MAYRSHNDTHHCSQKGVQPTSNRHTRPSFSQFSFYCFASPFIINCLCTDPCLLSSSRWGFFSSLCGSVLTDLCGSLVKPAFVWNSKARWAQVWMAVWGESSIQHYRWVISDVVGHLLCSKMVIPVWHRWIIFLLFQTIGLPQPRCLLIVVPKVMFFSSSSDVRGQQSLDLRSWPSCVVSSVYGEVVLSLQCTNLYIASCIELHELSTEYLFLTR